jgi:hypothetical protein
VGHRWITFQAGSAKLRRASELLEQFARLWSGLLLEPLDDRLLVAKALCERFHKTALNEFYRVAAAAVAVRHHPCLPHALAVWTRIAASLGGFAYGQRNRAHGHGRILALDADHSALTVGIAVGFHRHCRTAVDRREGCFSARLDTFTSS